MGHTRSIVRGAFLVLFIFCTTCIPASAKDVGDPVLGYTARIPDTWIQFKSRMIGDIQERVTGGRTTNFEFVDGFGTGIGATGAPLYPYALVSKVSYPTTDEITSISERELKNIVATVSGLNAADIQKQLASNAPVIPQIGKMHATYSTSPPGFQLETAMNVPKIGQVHCKSVGFFGKTQAVQIMIYDRDSNWANDAAHFDQMLASFQLDSAHQVPLGAASGMEPASFDTVWMHLIELFVIAGLFAIFVAWKFKKT